MHRTPTPRLRRSQLAAAVLALSAITAASASHAGNAAPASARHASASHSLSTTTQLPRGVTPLHYILSLTPDAAASTFKGEAAIKVAVDAPTASITFNALDLAFGAAAIEGAGGSKQVTRKIDIDAATQTATVHFARPLAKGEYLLRIDYSGKIGTQATVCSRSTTTRRKGASARCTRSSRTRTRAACCHRGMSRTTRPRLRSM